MRVAVLTPLPPTRSGVAHYASLLLPALARRVEVRAFDTLEGYRREDFDAVVYQLGNNPHHEVMYAEAMREPGVVVLHDLVLHHLVVEMTLARGDLQGYVAALEASHGPAGAAWAYGRAAGLHMEMANFLMPASIEVARRSRAIIVHNEYARGRLQSFGVTTPIHLVPHPYVPEQRAFDRQALRARLGFADSTRVIGFFGFLTSAKRAEVVLEAFRIARERMPALGLLIVGEPAPDIDLRTLQQEGIVATGYVADDDFPSYYAVADRLVNLRYPSAGETSGTLIRAFDAGKPVAVSNYAQFAELPDACVFKVPLGAGELDRLVEFFTADLLDPSELQREWLETNATVEKTVAGYLQALEAQEIPPRSVAAARAGTGLPIFPELELVDAKLDHSVEGAAALRITLRNRGTCTIRTRSYGQPEYRVLVKLLAGDRITQDQWLALPRDVAPGEEATVTMSVTDARTETLQLHHALQDVPMLDPAPWTEVRLVR